MASYSHEKLNAKVTTVFTEVVNSYEPGVTTEQQIEQTVSDYIRSNFKIADTNDLYVRAMIGDITYMEVSNLIEDLKMSINLEKCCKYDETNKIFLIVLITLEQQPNN